MRFLADEGISRATVDCLKDLGHDVSHVRDIGMNRTSDAAILEYARRENRTVITFDLDFGDLMAAAGELLPSVILLRTRVQTPNSVNPKLLDALRSRMDDLERGAILIVGDSRHRMRPLPLDSGPE